MGLFRRRKPKLTRQQCLAAIAVRNPLARAKPLKNGQLELELPLEKTRLGKWFSFGSDKPLIRRYQLDALGRDVWEMIDGKRPVRALIEQFAAKHRLNLREAEVSMMAYLRTLASRGIIALAVETPSKGRKPDKTT